MVNFLFNIRFRYDILVIMNGGEIKMNIGERIKYVRMLRGMRQEELAGKIGLGYNANGRTRISQYENGKRTPKKICLRKFVKH